MEEEGVDRKATKPEQPATLTTPTLPPLSSCSFTIPTLPKSCNAIYQIIWHWHKFELKPEIRLWKNTAMTYIPKFNVKDNDKVDLYVELHNGWYYKNGRMKREDLINLLKILVDAIAKKQDWDDKLIWEFNLHATKIDSKEEKVVCRVETINCAQGH